MSYLLDLNQLKIGDIILESGNSKFSWWIKYGTKSQYSHAMIYVGNSIIHALTDGVYTENPQRIIVDSINNLKVLRLIENNNDVASKAVQNARYLIGSLYSKKEAVLSVAINKTKRNKLSSSQFCSRLVSQVYYKAGISLVNNIDYCTPEDINNSILLKEVTCSVRKAREIDIIVANSYNPIKENQRRTFKYLNKCRDLFKKRDIIIQSQNDVASELVDNRDLDTTVCRYMIDSQYLDHYDTDKKLHPYKYNIKKFIDKINESRTPLDEVLVGELNNEVQYILPIRIKNYNLNKQNYINLNLQYFKLLMELNKNLLILLQERIQVYYQLSLQIKQNDISQKCHAILLYIKETID